MYADLGHALEQNVLADAALDVVSVEPPPHDHPLIGLTNCLITHHIAWLSKEARERIMKTTAKNIHMALKGNPQHVVN